MDLVGLGLPNHGPDSVGGNEDLEDRQTAFDIDAFKEGLGNHRPQTVGEGGTNLGLFSRGEHFDHTIHRFGGTGRVQGRENQVPRGCRFDGQADGFQIPHFAHQDDVGSSRRAARRADEKSVCANPLPDGSPGSPCSRAKIRWGLPP